MIFIVFSNKLFYFFGIGILNLNMKSFMICSCNLSFFYFTMPFSDILFLIGYHIPLVFIPILLIYSIVI